MSPLAETIPAMVAMVTMVDKKTVSVERTVKQVIVALVMVTIVTKRTVVVNMVTDIIAQTGVTIIGMLSIVVQIMTMIRSFNKTTVACAESKHTTADINTVGERGTVVVQAENEIAEGTTARLGEISVVQTDTPVDGMAADGIDSKVN